MEQDTHIVTTAIPKLTGPQIAALRLCWLADRNPNHPALAITGFLSAYTSYSDYEGHVRSGCELTRTPTMIKLLNLGLIDRMDSYTFHITEKGRIVAACIGCKE